MSERTLRIKTHHVYPPIPVRSFDWCAWFDNFGEEGPTGNGATEAEAIEELMATVGLTAKGPAQLVAVRLEKTHEQGTTRHE